MKKELLNGSIMFAAGMMLVAGSYAYDQKQVVTQTGAEAMEVAVVMEARDIELKTSKNEDAESTDIQSFYASDIKITDVSQTKVAKTIGMIRVQNELEKAFMAKVQCGAEDLENLAVVLEDGLNVRAKSNKKSEVIGSLNQGDVVKVLKVGKKWTKVKTAYGKGYVKNDYIMTGFEAKKYVVENYEYVAVPNVSSLYVRAKKNIESDILQSVGFATRMNALSAGKKWVKVALEDGQMGFVSAEYVELCWSYELPEETEEEVTEEDTTEENTEETEATTEEEREEDTEAPTTEEQTTEEETEEDTEAPTTEEDTTEEETTEEEPADDPDADLIARGQAVVDYAMQFLGNPYVYGGTSLTEGTDCSGFTMSVYAHFGYKLNRTSYGQRSDGRGVGLDELIPGDIICYPGHVALYIGNGQIIHASTPETGIKISNMYYRTPSCARRILK